jgi:hypothetical protein
MAANRLPMSLAIDTDLVTDVLLSDGWHHVEDDSFDIDSYEYLDTWWNETDKSILKLGAGQEPLIPTRGFSFREKSDDKNVRTVGPLTSIIALRTRQQTQDEERRRR